MTIEAVQFAELLPQDFEAVMTLWNATPGVRAGESREEFERILARNPGLGIVARLAEGIVGAMMACHDGRRGYLYHLAVAVPHRRKGIAREMVERCLVKLAAAGISRCSIFLVADNDAGAEFWLRSGWRERTDLRLMARDLA